MARVNLGLKPQLGTDERHLIGRPALCTGYSMIKHSRMNERVDETVPGGRRSLRRVRGRLVHRRRPRRGGAPSLVLPSLFWFHCRFYSLLFAYGFDSPLLSFTFGSTVAFGFIRLT